ncbi:winged helix-turn-helix transcriptional regulator [Allonocardiopsis opalescens]|uniref:HxlR family transcriptional regulator n=1 Tax=Allonocardiopsis opalescens TaxID=1144618 RepID=A0A2T0Q5I2_9ACTN|nr:helix-turn-helix domain-containing protein [Allonocardiopsis opalescens]PRX99033.1 HxlR family transcriptional regulator [Allonocardiopsis opalescens]
MAGLAPPARNTFDRDCPSRTVLNHVSSRWGILVLSLLRERPHRFFLLRDRIDGISEKMLSQTLRQLASDGLVERRVRATSPPQVSYALTPLGQELAEHVQALLDWIVLRTDDILLARARAAG